MDASQKPDVHLVRRTDLNPVEKSAEISFGSLAEGPNRIASRKPRLETPVRRKVKTAGTGRFEALMRSRDQRLADGQALRETVPRTSHAVWKRPEQDAAIPSTS